MNINWILHHTPASMPLVLHVAIAEITVTHKWEKLFHIGGTYIIFVLKGTILIRSENVIYNTNEVLFTASGTSFFEFNVSSDAVFVIIAMKPTAFRQIFNLDAADYTAKFIPAKTAIGIDLLDLLEEIRNCDTWEGIAERLFRWLEEEYPDSGNSGGPVDDFIEYIHSKNGCVKMLDISNRFRISRRTLEKHFKRDVGTSPASYAKACRFASVLTMLEQSKHEHIEMIISILDFYDYSHFQKDFKRFMGVKFQDYIKEKKHPFMEHGFLNNPNFSRL